MKLMLDCQAMSRLLSAAQDDTQAAPDRARMRLHLVMCEACRNVDEQMDFMRRAMRALGQEQAGLGRPDSPAPDQR